jgi:RNA polymerase sigma-70 factor (ECF subfamily)
MTDSWILFQKLPVFLPSNEWKESNFHALDGLYQKTQAICVEYGLQKWVHPASMGEKMLDEELVQLLQLGKREAFGTLVSKWQDRIYTFCLRQLGEHALAEEATQDVFVKVFTSIQGFRKESKFSTWLYRIATNHCINLNEKHHRRHRNEHDSLDTLHYEPASTASPLQDLERKDLEHSIQQALNQLPDEHRALLILRDIQDCSYEEIAEITRLNVGTIKSRIHRGRNNLRLILQGALGHE